MLVQPFGYRSGKYLTDWIAEKLRKLNAPFDAAARAVLLVAAPGCTR